MIKTRTTGLALAPALAAFGAGARTTATSQIDASHVAFISHPQVVARLIEQAPTALAR